MQVKLEGNTINDVVKHMSDMMIAESKKQDAQEIAAIINEEYPYASDEALARIIGTYFFKIATFEPDPISTQRLKTINRLIRDGRANCVQYTIAIGAVFLALNRPVTIRTVAYKNARQFDHVYPIINGIACDVVIGQRQGGDEHLFRKIGQLPTIGHELPYIAAQDTNVNL